VGVGPHSKARSGGTTLPSTASAAGYWERRDGETVHNEANPYWEPGQDDDDDE